MSAYLSLSEHPHDSKLSGATFFDRDGIPTKEPSIIKEGVLQTYLHDAYSAKNWDYVLVVPLAHPFAFMWPWARTA